MEGVKREVDGESRSRHIWPLSRTSPRCDIQYVYPCRRHLSLYLHLLILNESAVLHTVPLSTPSSSFSILSPSSERVRRVTYSTTIHAVVILQYISNPHSGPYISYTPPRKCRLLLATLYADAIIPE